MNEKAHWNRIGSNYNEEIFDVFKSDRKGRLPFYFRKHAGKNRVAIDFGCGTGKSFSYLAPWFKNIFATDISDELLTIAKKSPYSNIDFKQGDLTSSFFRAPRADFAFCCNVVMLPEHEKNRMMFRNIRKSLKPKGSALLVVPSFESVLLSAQRLVDWYRKEGVEPKNIPGDELNYFRNSKIDILQGLVQIDGVTTKHYTDRELHILMKEAGLRISNLERLEYAWDTEFSSPPKWMKEPYPWDWLVETSVA
jgi:SAM-dependent methyltransferase